MKIRITIKPESYDLVLPDNKIAWAKEELEQIALEDAQANITVHVERIAE